MAKSGIWAEDFRPSTLDECVLPERILNVLKEARDQGAGSFPHLMFEGPPGGGKTTAAIALANDLKADWIKINGSEDSGIDVLRTKVRQFASSMSLTSDCPVKIVILDESDHLNSTSTQPALRGFIDEFAQTCRFIFTCNFKEKVLEPVRDRLSVISFAMSKEESDKMKPKAFERIKHILMDLGINFDPKSVAMLVNREYPALRKMLVLLQSYSMQSGGTIDSGILSACSKAKVKEFFESLKSKNFGAMRKLVAESSELTGHEFFSNAYASLSTYLEPASVPAAILILADYQDRASRVSNPEINVVACGVELMKDCEFK